MSSSNNDTLSQNQPPAPNPVLTAYESFVDKTPLVTRYILSCQFICYVASYVVNPLYALSNIPTFTLWHHFEVYRIVTSPLVNTSIFSLVFSFVSFLDIGKRLECGSMGSAAFGWLCFMLALVSNVAFLVLCIVMYIMTGEETWLLSSAHGIWLVLFGIIAMDGAQQDSNARRFLFALAVPARLYPFVLYALFALLNQDLQLGYLISLILGYAIGMGRIPQALRPWFLLSPTKVQQWEETVLAQWMARPGWVAGTGSGITIVSPASQQQQAGGSSSSTSGGMMGLPLLQPRGEAGAAVPSLAAAPEAIPDASGGRMLGGSRATRRAADTRAARLQALEGGNTTNSVSSSKETKPLLR